MSSYVFFMSSYRLKSFLEQHNILHDSQYGFREKRSTEHALLDIINQIETNMGAELYSCGIFIDLRKAFDTVDHQILLSKLLHYGVRGIINRWFSSYSIYWVVSKQHKLVLTILLKRKQFCQESLRGRYWDLCFF